MNQEDTCPICLTEFEHKRDLIFNFKNSILNNNDFISDDNKGDLKYQLNCNCGGSIYHLKCIKHVINLDYMNCKCCYCREDVSIMDKYRLNNIPLSNIEYTIINTRTPLDEYLENTTSDDIKRAHLKVYGLTMFFNVVSFLINYFDKKEVFNMFQSIQIIEFILNMRFILWLLHESIETRHDLFNTQRGLKAILILIIIFNIKSQFYILLSIISIFVFPLSFLI